MAFYRADSDPLSRRRRLSPALLSCLALGLLVSVSLPGCGGCGCWKRPDAQAKQRMKTPEELEKELLERQAKLREEARKKLPNIQFGDYVSLPYEPRSMPEGERASACFYKPGHWTGTMLSARANHFDVMGDLETSIADAQGKPLGLLAMPYTVVASRQVALAKGQPKTFQSVFFPPVTAENLNLSTRLVARKGGRGIWGKSPPVTRMPAWQYHFVVLARFPENYAFLKGLDSVKRPTELNFEDSGQDQAFYRVSLLNAEKKAALPSGALFWTSTACVLWDDASPEALSLDQQVALLDWLHWGGQLILSGPDTLDTLRNSFLADYLPAESDGSRNLTQADLEELNRNWTIDIRKKPGPPLVPVVPMTAVKFKAHPQGRFLAGTGDLVVERRVGRGRIVVTAFPLSHRDLTTWPSFDGFFNGCILRRPRRIVARASDMGLEYTGEVYVTWADENGSPNRSRQKDPGVISNLRYFTRDTGAAYFVNVGGVASGPLGGYEAPEIVGGGVGAWNDFNSVASACRDALHEAAQIEIPEAIFLVWVMSGYLIVLVPLNWFVFRLIDRVEWAWAAAPLIAIGCAMLVIHLARLDIGFARSRTEIGVVEMQGDYPRAHLGRYAVLYSSLTTRYRIASEDPGTQMQPFPTVRRPEDFSLQLGQRLGTLPYVFGKNVSLDRFQVLSNSTGYTHCEQMIDTGGPILLDPLAGGVFRVTNRTGLSVHGAGVVRGTDLPDGETGPATLEIAWLGTLEPEAAADFRFRAVPDDRPPSGLWSGRRDESPLTARGASPGGLNLRGLVDLAEGTRDLQPGDVRLVGWIDEPLPGIQIKPAASQSRSAAVLVAHLQYGPGPEPKRDVNSRYDFIAPRTRVLSPESPALQAPRPREPETSPSSPPSPPQPPESAND